MAFKANNSNNSNSSSNNYKATVKRAICCKNNTIMFNLELNGVNIYGCFLKQYTDENGNTMEFIAKPSMKGKNGQYYEVVKFPVSEELYRDIRSQIDSLLG